MRILIIEDEKRMAQLLRRVLEEEHYTVALAHDGVAGEALARHGAYDAIVLDVMLPSRDGLAICRNLRRDQIATPILMLTARDAIEDRVQGLDLGADDYLVKPFAFAEFLARVRAVSRRRPGELPTHRLECAGLSMDLVRREVQRDGKRIDLTPREFALLEYFLRHPGQVLSRAQIRENVWQYDADVTSNVVDIYVHYLRDKIDRGQARKLLQTVWGIGYVLRA